MLLHNLEGCHNLSRQQRFLLLLCPKRDIRAREMHWPKTGATQYYKYLEHPGKGHEIKELVICWDYLT